MAGPSSIQKVPTGLLSFLDMKGTGANPVDLTPGVVPILNVTEAYDYPLELAVADVAVNSPNDEAQLIVPATERWRVLGIGYGVSATGGGNFEAFVGLRLPRSGSTEFMSIMPREEPQTLVAGRPWFTGQLLANPLWLEAGSIIAARVVAIASTGTTLSPEAIIRRLQA